VSHSQNWSYSVPTTGSNWATTYTEGYSDGTATEGRSAVYGFSGSNAAIQSVAIQGTAGNTQTTNFNLTASGQDGSLTASNGSHMVATGKPTVDVTATLTKTTLPSGTYLSVGGVPAQSTQTVYNSLPQYLDWNQPTSTTVTRSNLVTGANLPSIVTTATYTAKGEPTKNSLQAGGQEKGQTYTYDTDGRLTKTGIIASWATDVSLATTYVPSPVGPTSATTTGNNISPSLGQTWTYYDSGTLASYTDPQGIKTAYTYDLRGRILTVSRTGSPTLNYSYSGERTRTWSQGRLSGSETYDGFGRLQSKLRADGVTETYTYDAYGRLIAAHEGTGGTSRTAGQKSYDALDRVISEQPASGPGASYAYSASGSNQVVTVTTTDGLTFAQTRDPWGQVIASTDPTGTNTTTVYNQFSQATQVTQSNGGTNQIRSFMYDGIGKLQTRTEPETKTTTYSAWNAQGLPGSVTDSKRTLTITYDALGRRRSVSNGGTSLTYSYTGAFLMGTASSDGVSQGFAYNGPGGRLSSESITIDGVARTVSYAYDGYAMLSSITYPIGSGRVVGYGYDTSNRVNQVTNNGVTLASVGYDGWGNRISMTFASGAKSQWTPDEFGMHLLNWTVNYAGGGDSRAYGYDASDRLNQAGEWGLQHDTLGRLTSASGFGLSTGQGYDGFGNDITHTVSTPAPAAFNAFGFNPLADNRIPALQVNGGSTGWAYADNGEASQIGTGVSSGRYLAMNWDAFGRLGTITDISTAAAQTFRYTPMGMRVALTDTSDASRNRQFVYTSGGLLLGEYLATGSWKRDVIYLGDQAIAEVDANGVHELHSDYLGTPRVITRASDGTVEGRQAFGPYGELIGTPIYTYGYRPLTGYTGHVQTDSTGLIYMRGRFFSPSWHRFINSDQGVDWSGWNQMAYAGGSPMQRIDPSGMAPKYVTMSDGKIIIDGGGGTAAVIADLFDYMATTTDPIPPDPYAPLGGGGGGGSQGGLPSPQTPTPPKKSFSECLSECTAKELAKKGIEKLAAFNPYTSAGLLVAEIGMDVYDAYKTGEAQVVSTIDNTGRTIAAAYGQKLISNSAIMGGMKSIFSQQTGYKLGKALINKAPFIGAAVGLVSSGVSINDCTNKCMEGK
jgi:RHS repeat-associated protein